MVAAIFQVGKGKDTFIHACPRQLWFTCAEWDITLGVSYISGEDLTIMSADVLSHWNMGQHYKDRVHTLVQD